MRRLLIAISVLSLASGQALGAEEKKKDEKAAPAGQYVDLAPVAMPIVVHGSLVNYVFVYVRINLKNGVDSVKLREKEPFFRDALVRAAHRTPFTNPADYTTVDVGKLQAAMMREAAAIAGPNAVKSAVVTSQSPKMRMGLPQPAVPPKS